MIKYQKNPYFTVENYCMIDDNWCPRVKGIPVGFERDQEAEFGGPFRTEGDTLNP